jgi:hypothetical protein
VTSRLGTGKSITFFYSVTEAEPTFTLQDNGEDKTQVILGCIHFEGRIDKVRIPDWNDKKDLKSRHYPFNYEHVYAK